MKAPTNSTVANMTQNGGVGGLQAKFQTPTLYTTKHACHYAHLHQFYCAQKGGCYCTYLWWYLNFYKGRDHRPLAYMRHCSADTCFCPAGRRGQKKGQKKIKWRLCFMSNLEIEIFLYIFFLDSLSVLIALGRTLKTPLVSAWPAMILDAFCSGVLRTQNRVRTHS